MKLPKARTENLLEQNLKNETLIYDLVTDKAFNLNETSSAVYKACGRDQTFADLKRESKFTDDFIFLALDELKRNNLLAESFDSPFANTNRREVIKKVGLATMFALPLISSLVAPKAVSAASSGSQLYACDLVACVDNRERCLPGRCATRLQACGDTFNSEPPFCADSFCRNTISGPRCCDFDARGPLILLPGQTYNTPPPDGSYRYFPQNSPPSSTTCEGVISCCDGPMPSGSCIYTRYTGDDEEVQRAEAEGFYAYTLDCTCSC